MTLEGALGRPPVDLEDLVLARAMFDIVKHDLADDAREAAIEKINGMTNWELVQEISAALAEWVATTPTSYGENP